MKYCITSRYELSLLRDTDISRCSLRKRHLRPLRHVANSAHITKMLPMLEAYVAAIIFIKACWKHGIVETTFYYYRLPGNPVEYQYASNLLCTFAITARSRTSTDKNNNPQYHFFGRHLGSQHTLWIFRQRLGSYTIAKKAETSPFDQKLMIQTHQ